MDQNEINEPLAQEEMPFLLLRSSTLNAITLCGLLRYLTNLESVNHQPLAGVLEAVGIENFAGFSFRFRIYDRLSDKSFYEKLLELEPRPQSFNKRPTGWWYLFDQRPRRSQTDNQSFRRHL
jgi:hypothetical protein